MNSLEFIKMHVDEWPSTNRHQLTHCMLLSNGILTYGAGAVGKINPYEHIDLSEHFAPDYYDGVVWTREDFESCGSNSSESPDIWSPTINSIVDVGDCEGVVRAIEGKHYWVLKDTGMYDTYHKDSLKKPLTEEEKLYKDVVSNIMGAAFVRSSVAEQLIQDLDKRGYKIVRKED